MMIGEHYWSTFLTEEHTLEQKLAWIEAYKQYLSESPNRPGWCQKKADDDWGKFMAEVTQASDTRQFEGRIQTTKPDIAFSETPCCAAMADAVKKELIERSADGTFVTGCCRETGRDPIGCYRVELEFCPFCGVKRI